MNVLETPATHIALAEADDTSVGSMDLNAKEPTGTNALASPETSPPGTPLRVLQVCGKSPWPKRDGAALATEAICLGLLDAGAHLRMLTLETNKHPFDPSAVPEALQAQTRLEAVHVDSDVKPLDAVKGLFSSDSYLVARFRSDAMKARLRTVLAEEKFDVVILESSFLGPYIPTVRAASDARVVIRSHNVEHALWSRRAKAERNPLKRPVFERYATQLANYEALTVAAADAVLAITAEDGATLNAMLPKGAPPVPMLTVPYAVELPAAQPAEIVSTPSVFHLGSMDWAPNRGGLRWFLDECWPRVRAARADAQLHIAGRYLAADDPEFSGPGVTVHGEVPDATAFTREHRAMIVPLLAGGGMRTKLVEAMALAKPIVSTTLGAEGTGLAHDDGAWIGDTPQAFADGVVAILDDNARALRCANAARDRAQDFDRGVVTARMIDFLRDLPRREVNVDGL